MVSISGTGCHRCRCVAQFFIPEGNLPRTTGRKDTVTLLDAPRYDAAKARKRARIALGSLAALCVLFVATWLAIGHPIEAPWNWYSYWRGQRVVDHFLHTVEANHLAEAYGIWNNDPDWQQHASRYTVYTFARFQRDWGPDSMDNEYGTISSHRIVVAKIWGSAVIVGSLMNGRKSHALFLAWDRRSHTLSFSPVELTLP